MKIKNINIPQAILLAPMEGITDLPFRLLCKKYGADIVYTEFINSEGLIRDREKTKLKMSFIDEEKPIGVQIYGGNEVSVENAAQQVEKLNPDLIDINCGCWVKKVVGHGAGAGLLKDPQKMYRLINSVVKAVNLPVTVKTRIGWDSNSINIADIAKLTEDAGAQALTIHCRTRSQGQKGTPDYNLIPQIKQLVKIPIIVNGGIDSAEKAKYVFDKTNCDAIMIGQAAIGNPWIFKEIKHYLNTNEYLPSISFSERVTTMIEHLRHSIQYKGERRAIIEFRKYYSGYLRNKPGISLLRSDIMKYSEVQPIINALNNFIYKNDSNSLTLIETT